MKILVTGNNSYASLLPPITAPAVLSKNSQQGATVLCLGRGR
ncbi:MAG: hypothetical protein GQF41_0639 [Candidatus Rifleibacterium amylolyticum]|nr:MAG: hypothetical protein GQF41_0639 [Candidatus Rifleibacterium amylolyticum]